MPRPVRQEPVPCSIALPATWPNFSATSARNGTHLRSRQPPLAPPRPNTSSWPRTPRPLSRVTRGEGSWPAVNNFQLPSRSSHSVWVDKNLRLALAPLPWFPDPKLTSPSNLTRLLLRFHVWPLYWWQAAHLEHVDPCLPWQLVVSLPYTVAFHQNPFSRTVSRRRKLMVRFQ